VAFFSIRNVIDRLDGAYADAINRAAAT
jgi:hypothetical protein